MKQTWTIKDILLWSSDYLKAKNSDTARLDSELIMCQALSCSRIDLYCHYDKPVNDEERQTIRDSLKKRADGEPVAYILGEKEFYGRSFQVSSDVLIPRPETEHLIEEVLSLHKQRPIERFLEIGVGSGAIALTLSKEISQLRGQAWDISKAAILVAESNANKLSVDSVEFLEMDALSDESWSSHEGKLDLICSNPPYIAETETNLMSTSVLDYEPHIALFAANDGLEFYEKIASKAASLLNKGGRVVVEIGAFQAEKVQEIFISRAWSEVRVIEDLAKHPRIIVATK